MIAVDHFVPGQINRTKEETMVCGGKGINVKMKSDEETEINGMGPRNVLVSMAKDGALLLTEDGDVYEEGVCRGNVINSVGAGEKAETEECSGDAEDAGSGNASKTAETGSSTGTANSPAAGSQVTVFWQLWLVRPASPTLIWLRYKNRKAECVRMKKET